MDPKAPAFTAYDFLGYFFPGALAVLFVDAAIAYNAAPTSFSYDALLMRYSGKDLGVALPFLIVSYIAGHGLSFLSSQSLERYAVWMHGHPSKYLLKMPVGGYFSVRGENKWASRMLRGVMWLLLLPVSAFEFFFGSVLRLRSNYIAPLDPLTHAAVWLGLNALVEKCGVQEPRAHGKPAEHDFWKLAVHYAVAHSPNHLFTLRNYVVLYGFLRTIAFVFVVAFWVVAIQMIFSAPWWMTVVVLCCASFICFAAFAAFVKFFQRYHEEALFAATIALIQKRG